MYELVEKKYIISTNHRAIVAIADNSEDLAYNAVVFDNVRPRNYDLFLFKQQDIPKSHKKIKKSIGYLQPKELLQNLIDQGYSELILSARGFNTIVVAILANEFKGYIKACILNTPSFMLGDKEYFQNITCPILFIHDEENKTTSLSVNKTLFSKIKSENKKLVLLNASGFSTSSKFYHQENLIGHLSRFILEDLPKQKTKA